MGDVLRFVKRQPSWVQRLYYALPFGWRYGWEYRQELKFLRHSQWWPVERLRAWQRWQLFLLMGHAYENVPYYRGLFDKCGIKTHVFPESVDVLKKLPILTRDDVRQNADRLVAQNVPKDTLIPFRTSGSTGAPLQFWGTESLWKLEAAHKTRAFEAAGIELYREKTVWLRRYVPSEGEPLYQYDHELRRLYLSAYHLTEKNIPLYVGLMNEYGARALVGYPSSLYIFATLCEQGKTRPRGLEVAHVASEQVLPEWKTKAEEVLGVPVRTHYGLMEKACLHFQCEQGNYHDALEYGVTEVVDGQVIGTGFLNGTMPFIRYATGDRAVMSDLESCPCGRGLPVAVRDFEGRCDDILMRPDGGLVPGVNFYTMMYRIQGVGMFQIVQHLPDEVEVKLVPGPGYLFGETQKRIKGGMRDRLGEVRVEVTVVPEIERSRTTGKVRCVERLCPSE